MAISIAKGIHQLKNPCCRKFFQTQGRKYILYEMYFLKQSLPAQPPAHPAGTAARAVAKALASDILLVSIESMAEVVNVLPRQKFDPYLTLKERSGFIRVLGSVAKQPIWNSLDGPSAQRSPSTSCMS